MNPYLLLLVLFCNTCFCYGQDTKEDTQSNPLHISINGNPNVFYLVHGNSNQFIGGSVLPELEIAVNAPGKWCGRIFLSLFYSGNTSLITSSQISNIQNPSNSPINAASIQSTNWAIAIGWEFNISGLIKGGDASAVSLPAINSFGIGIGYANFDMGDSNFHEGFIITAGLKVKIVSFNVGAN